MKDWIDIKDAYGAVLESHHKDGIHFIRPLSGQWDCLNADTGHLVATHPCLSVIKRLALERMEADSSRAPR